MSCFFMPNGKVLILYIVKFQTQKKQPKLLFFGIKVISDVGQAL
ncbi:hypothetical protein PSPO_a1999 [Pseudoalteromonas spongiae UST010723-006]|nr:hypothetical protein PSPO_a1999 [Pseudoalteromonas spongiae UST010723-006]